MLAATEGAREFARDQPGVPGIIGGIQSSKFERRVDAGNLKGAFKTIAGTYDLAQRFSKDKDRFRLPTAGEIAMSPVNWARDRINPNQEDSAGPYLPYQVQYVIYLLVLVVVSL